MSVGMQDPNIVVSADVTNYVQGMQTGYQETSKFSKSVVDLSNKIDDLRRNTARKILIADTAAMAVFAGTTASAARLEDQMSQLEARSVLVSRNFNTAAASVKSYNQEVSRAGQIRVEPIRQERALREQQDQMTRLSRQDFSQTIRSVSDLRREYGMAAESAISLITVMNQMGSPNIQQSRNLASNYVRLSAVTGDSVSGLAMEQNQLMRTMGRGRLSPQAAENYSSMTAGLSQRQGVSALQTLQFANNIAPMSRNMGMNQAEIMGFSTSFQRAGQDSGAASTAFNRILSSINFSKQWGGKDAKIYARYIGKSEAEFNKMPIAEAMTQIFEKISREGPQGAKFLEKQGFEGIRTQNAITAVAQSGGLRQNITEAAAAYRDPSGYQRASEAALSGLNEESRKTAETFKELVQVIGGIFLPGMTAAARLFNDTVGRVAETISDMLKAIPDPMKDFIGGLTGAAIALKGIMLALGVSGITKLAVGGLGASRIWNGPMATGMKSVMAPGQIGNPSDAAMFAGNQGTWLQQRKYDIGQRMGSFLSTPLHMNPAKLSDEQKSAAAKKIEDEVDERRKTRTRMETERKLGNVIPVSSTGQADPDSMKSASKSLEESSKNLKQATDPGSPTRRAQWAASLRNFAMDNTVVNKAQETAEKARSAAVNAANAASQAVEGQTPVQLAKQGGIAGIRGVRGAARWAAGGLSQIIGSGLDTGDGYNERARDNAMLKATYQKETFLYRRAMEAGGWDADTVQGRRFRSAIGEGTPDYTSRLKAVFADSRRIDNTPGADTGLMTVGRRGIGTAAGGLMRGAGMVGSALGGAALGMLPGLIIGGGIAAVGGGIAMHQADRDFRRGLSETEGVTAPTEIYAQSLGLATDAVKDFGEAIKDATPDRQRNKTLADALNITELEASQYSGKTERVVNTGLLGASKEQATGYMASLLSSTNSVDIIGTAAADLAAVFNSTQAQEIINAAQQQSRSGTYQGFFNTAAVQTKAPGNIWERFFPQKYDNTELANQAYAGIAQRVGDAGLMGGDLAQGDEFRAALEEMIKSSQTANNDVIKESENVTQHLRGLLSPWADMDSKAVRDFLSNVEDTTRTGAFETTWWGSQSRRPLTEEELADLINKGIKNIELPFDLNSQAGNQVGDLKRGTPGWLRMELENGGYSEDSFDSYGAKKFRGLLTTESSQYQRRFGGERDPERQAYITDAIGKEASEAQRFTAARMMTTDLTGEVGGNLVAAKTGAMEFVVAMDGATNGLDSFAAAVLANVRGLETLQRSSQGRTGLAATSQDALRDVNSARRLYEANPENDAAKQMFEQAAQVSIGKQQELDSFFQNSARSLISMQFGQEQDRASLTRSQGRAREEFGISMGRQQTSRNRQLGWEGEDFTRSMGERSEDFYRSRAYQEEDFNRSRKEAFFDFHRSRLYAEEDFARSQHEATTDFYRSRRYQEADYQKSRRREEQDYNHQIELMAAATAKNVFDIYSRAAVERTWSLQGLLQNVADQQERMTEQKSNLNAIRKLGVSDAVIEQLGLTEGGKAQQLERLLNGLRNGEGSVAQLNSAIGNRVRTAGQLATDPSNPQFREQQRQRELGIARGEEDFREGMRRSEEGFDISMTRQSESFERNAARSLESFQLGMQRQEEAWQRGNERQLEEFNRQGIRMNNAHERSLKRGNILFNEQVAQANEDFQRSADNQWKDLEFSHEVAMNQFEFQLREYTISTEQSYKTVMGNVSKVTQDTLKETKKTYDELSKTNKLIYAEVGVSVADLTPAREFSITQTVGAGGVVTWKVGGGTATTRGSSGGMGTHTIGGPEANADVAHAKGLGGANATGGGIDYKVGKVSQGFHGAHPGVDIPGRTGDPVRAAGDGVVAFAGNGGAYGNFTKIVHDGGLETWYGHQSILGVHKGDTVSSGQPIGTVGNTGHSSGPHLHYEVRINGRAVDPGAEDLDAQGGVGGPNYHNSANFKKWESIIDRTPYRLKLRRGGLADMWNRRVAEREAAEEANNQWTPPPGRVVGNRVSIGRHVLDAQSYSLLKAAERIYGRAMTVTQGAFNSSVKASGSTHTGAGVIDSLPAVLAAMNALRKVGAASWIREPWEGPWNRHIHTVFPVPGLSVSAAAQYRSYLAGNNGLGKKDRYPHVDIDPAFARAATTTTQSTQTTTVNGATRPVPNKHSGWNGGVYRSSGKWHGGLDFPAATGTPVRAMWDGNVTAANYWNYSYGRHVRMTHPNGLETLYAHMSRILVDKGDRLRSGQQLGNVGNTGNSYGSHLHLEVRRGGKQLNPTTYLPGYASGTASAIAGARPVGEHGMEIIFSKSLKQFLGGETVLNTLQTRNAFGRGLGGVQTTGTAGPSSIHYDNSMRVEKMEVVANDTGEFYEKAKRDQRLRALSGGR